MDKVGVYKARAVKSSDGTWAQYGERDNGNLELILNMKMAIDGGELVRSVPLYFSPAAAEYSFERLRALGWKGQKPEDIADLTGIDTNVVDIEVTVESWGDKDRNKYNILTGGGRFTVQKAVDPKMFGAKLAALSGSMGAAPTAGNAAPPPKPPF